MADVYGRRIETYTFANPPKVTNSGGDESDHVVNVELVGALHLQIEQGCFFHFYFVQLKKRTGGVYISPI